MVFVVANGGQLTLSHAHSSSIQNNRFHLRPAKRTMLECPMFGQTETKLKVLTLHLVRNSILHTHTRTHAPKSTLEIGERLAFVGGIGADTTTRAYIK